jgi:2'-5' RNA ligase
MEAVLAVREKLVAAIDRQGVRFVKPEKIHLTLAFLGSVDDDEIEALKADLHAVRLTEFSVRVSEIGAFPDMGRPKVVWIGLDGDVEKLESLAKSVAEAAKPHAPELDEKPFSPHITLARLKPGSKEVGRILRALAPPIEREVFPITSFQLIHSKPDGSYEAILDVRASQA